MHRPDAKTLESSHVSFPCVARCEIRDPKSKPGLQTLQAAFGFIPNIAASMASSAVLIDSLVGLFKHVHGGSFSEQQIQTVLLTNAVTNRSAYPVALHTVLGLNEHLDPADVRGDSRRGRLPQDPKLAALSALAKNIDRKAGPPPPTEAGPGEVSDGRV